MSSNTSTVLPRRWSAPRYTLEDLRGRNVLLVANTGGHLTQLTRLAPRFDLGADSLWVTFDTPQSRGLLAGRNVHYVPYIKPRDARAAAHAAWSSRHLWRDYEGAISTGAALAVAELPPVLALGKPAVYIESISRVEGPSLSGRMLAQLPRLGLYAQHAWASDPWRLGPSVLSTYEAGTSATPAPLPRRIYVTLGTIQPYRFDRLVDLVRMYQDRHRDVEVRWQLGCTSRDDLVGDTHVEMASKEFHESLDWADAVVAHSGVGVSMSILDAGKMPILLAREPERGEHVDPHQRQIRDYLVQRGLAADAETALVDDDDMRRVCSTTITVNLDGEPATTPTGQKA